MWAKGRGAVGWLFVKQEVAQGLASSPGSSPWLDSIAKAIYPLSVRERYGLLQGVLVSSEKGNLWQLSWS